MVERVIDRFMAATFWPLEQASGKAIWIRLVAITVGWCWILPMFVLTGIVIIVIGMPWALWESTR